MRSMSDTLARLARLQAQQNDPAPAASPLVDLVGFGTNPGQLEAKIHVPRSTTGRPALVVVLHGCTQTAASYDEGAGWSRLADDYGFIVLYPQQVRQNNAHTCFNWFVPGDTKRGAGEALSIRQMIDCVANRYAIDEKRIFVTGLSAGGAMANVMLATYPELFAGGTIIAGLPYGIARTAAEAFDRMRGHGIPETEQLQAILSAGSPHQGPWPTVSIWHGSRDTTVVAANATAIAAQWSGVHGLDGSRETHEVRDGHAVTRWVDTAGRIAVEQILVDGLAHGTPIDTGDGYGRSGPYMLDVGISSTLHSARASGLMPAEKRRDRRPDAISSGVAAAPPAHGGEETGRIQQIIETALRSAGLLK